MCNDIKTILQNLHHHLRLWNFIYCEIKYSICSKRKRKKKQRDKIFEESFYTKECQSMKFILEKIKYIHHDPVSKRWQWVNDFTEYEYSSASFYEKGIKKYEKLVHVNDVLQQF